MHDQSLESLKSLECQRESTTRRLLQKCEVQGLEASRAGPGKIEIAIPSWDSAFFPALEVGFSRGFWEDRLTAQISEDGTISYSPDYFSKPQVLLHVLVTAVFAIQAWIAPAGLAHALHPLSYLAALVASHAAVLGGVYFSFARAKQQLTR